MHKITTTFGRNTSIDYRADVPMNTAPVIDHEFYAGTTRMYKIIDGREFIADIYDHNFKSAAKKRVRTKAEADYIRRRFSKTNGR
jgi:hypothetical protein